MTAEARPDGARLEHLRRSDERRSLPLAADSTVVSLTFDDGYSDQYRVRSLLAWHSMCATFYVNSGSVGGPGMMTWRQLADLTADGNEIGGHAVEHLNLTMLGSSEARRQISDDREALLSHGLNPMDFAYPSGAYNSSVKSIVQDCGYSSARRAWGLCPIGQAPPDCEVWYQDVVEGIPPDDRYAIRTIVSPRAWHTVSDLEGVVTRAETNGGGWVTLVFHHVGDGCDPNGYFISPPLLARFLNWLASRADRGTRVLTVQDVISQRAVGVG
jgi:peptidoglycan/xylan/chitin deacetylase (PgdA/CDA1 family)